MKWYVVYTKPRQEARAAEHLRNQGYQVFYPTWMVEKIIKGALVQICEPLFARYAFVRLDARSDNFGPIRSTRGVQQLLRFGQGSDPVTVPDALVQILKERPHDSASVRTLFEEGDTVTVKSGPFLGLEGRFEKIFTNPSGEQRALLLLEFLGKQQRVSFAIDQVVANK